MPMSHLFSSTAVIPEPEPVGLKVNLMPVFSEKASPRPPITFSAEVDPSVETVSTEVQEEKVSNIIKTEIIIFKKLT